MGHLKSFRSKNLRLTTVFIGNLVVLVACGNDAKKGATHCNDAPALDRTVAATVRAFG